MAVSSSPSRKTCGPERCSSSSDETLRAVGLTANNARSLRDLAANVLDGTVVLSPRGLSRHTDEEVIARLCSVRGMGPWTTPMFLIFRLRRLDVWPTGGFGVRQGYGLAWNEPMPAARELEPRGNPYRPLPHGRRRGLPERGRDPRGHR